MAKVTALQQKGKPTFNPQASYNWEPTDLFEITGQQLAYLYHCLIKEVSSTEGSTPLQKYEAYNVVLDVFKRGVEQGAIVESGSQMTSEKGIEEIEEKVDNLFRLPHHHNHPNG